MTTATGQDLYYDPYDVGIDADPYPVFRRLRDEAPLYYNEPYDFYAVSRFEDVERGLRDARRFISGDGAMLELIQAGHRDAARGPDLRGPARCTRSTAACCRACSRPRRVAALEPQIREFCAAQPRPARGRRPLRLRRRPRGARCRCG